MVNTKMDTLPWNKERLKRSIPVPEAMPAGYRYMIRKKTSKTGISYI